MTPRHTPHMNPSSGNQFPSPLFSGRPGWGGQLKSWLAENAYLITFRLILAVAMALVVVSIIRNHPEETAVVETPVPTMTHDREMHLVTATVGDGLSDLAARALDEHLTDYPDVTLTAGAHLYVVDSLWRAALALQSHSAFILKVGSEVSFPHSAIEAAISEFDALEPAQKASWERLTQ